MIENRELRRIAVETALSAQKTGTNEAISGETIVTEATKIYEFLKETDGS